MLSTEPAATMVQCSTDLMHKFAFSLKPLATIIMYDAWQIDPNAQHTDKVPN
jgi:hypothetical protein